MLEERIPPGDVRPNRAAYTVPNVSHSGCQQTTREPPYLLPATGRGATTRLACAGPHPCSTAHQHPCGGTTRRRRPELAVGPGSAQETCGVDDESFPSLRLSAGALCSGGGRTHPSRAPPSGRGEQGTRASPSSRNAFASPSHPSGLRSLGPLPRGESLWLLKFRVEDFGLGDPLGILCDFFPVPLRATLRNSLPPQSLKNDGCRAHAGRQGHGHQVGGPQDRLLGLRLVRLFSPLPPASPTSPAAARLRCLWMSPALPAGRGPASRPRGGCSGASRAVSDKPAAARSRSPAPSARTLRNGSPPGRSDRGLLRSRPGRSAWSETPGDYPSKGPPATPRGD